MEITPQQLAKIERKIAEMERQDRVEAQYNALQQYESLIQAEPPKQYTAEQLDAFARNDFRTMDWSDYATALNGGLTTDEVAS